MSESAVRPIRLAVVKGHLEVTVEKEEAKHRPWPQNHGTFRN